MVSQTRTLTLTHTSTLIFMQMQRTLRADVTSKDANCLLLTTTRWETKTNMQ